MGKRMRFAGFAVVSLALIGCGGSGGSGSPGDPNPNPNPGPDQQQPEGTAKLIVNVETGQVQVVPLRPSSRAVFAGEAIQLQSTELLASSGNTGRRVLRVALKNNSGEPIGSGQDGTVSGVKVVFTGFKLIDSSTNMRSLTQLTTFAGGAFGSDDGPLSSATFRGAAGIAIAPNGTMYIADTINHRIRKISNGYVSTLAGKGIAGGTDGIGQFATFNRPYGICLSPDGSLWVSEQGGNRVRIVQEDGSVRTIAGNGTAGFADGSSNTVMFSAPEGMVWSNGSLYICDSNNRRIRQMSFLGGDKLNPANYQVSTFAGNATAGLQDGPGAIAKFRTPRGIACDTQGNLYVTDRTNNCVRMISPLGDVVTIAGSGTAGTSDGNGATAGFDQPAGIATITDGTSNTLLLSETGNSSLRQLYLSPGATPGVATNWNVRWIACDGTAGFNNGSGSNARVNAPLFLQYWNGHVYLMDSGNNMVRQVSCSLGFPVPSPSGNSTTELPAVFGPDRFTPANEPVIEYAGALQPGQTTAAKDWQFVVPEGVKLFEAVVRVEAETEYGTGLAAVFNSVLGPGSPENLVSAYAGTGAAGFINGNLTTASFFGLSSIAFADDGTAFVAEVYNNAIRRIDRDGTVSTVLGGPTTMAAPDNGLGSQVNGKGLFALTVAPDGKTIYFVNYNDSIVRCASLTGADPKMPRNWTVATIAGLSGSLGDSDGNGTIARFKNPYAMARSKEGVLYVCELQGHRIRMLTNASGLPLVAENWQVDLLAGSATGDSGYTEGLGAAARFTGPASVAVGPDGTIYVGDNYLRIRKITPYGLVSTLAGGAVGGYTDGAGTAARFNGVYALTADEAGYVYVGDSHRIRRISPQGEVRTVAGHSPGFLNGGGNLSVFQYVDGLAFSPSGTLYALTGGAIVNNSSDRRVIKTVQRIISK